MSAAYPIRWHAVCGCGWWVGARDPFRVECAALWHSQDKSGHSPVICAAR